jgi:hypothetical protein
LGFCRPEFAEEIVIARSVNSEAIQLSSMAVHVLAETSLPGSTRQSIIFQKDGCADQVRA